MHELSWNEEPEPPTRARGISVLVPTYRRHAIYIGDFLNALEASAAGSDKWECIIIDDPPPYSSGVIEEICREHGARYIQGPRRVSAKVNRGARVARYATILDLGADCFPEPGLLAAHLIKLSEAPPEVAGVAGLVRFVGARPWYWRIADFYGYNACYGWASTRTELQWAPINVCFRTQTFLALDGYPDEGWTRSGGDDVALGERLRQARLHLWTSDTAVVTTPRSDLRPASMLRALFRYGGADAWLCSAFPHRRLIDVNPLALAAAVGCLFGLGARATGRPGGPIAIRIAIMLLVINPASRVAHYGTKAARARCQPAEGSMLVVGAVLMGWLFRLGALTQALRKAKPWLAAFSFDYDERVECRS